jgi:hypothetical protein
MQGIHFLLQSRKKINFRLVLLTSLTSFALIIAASPAKSAELTSNGVSLTWKDSLYKPNSGCSNFDFNYRNGSNINLLNIKLSIQDPYGREIGWKWASGGVDNGVTGVFTVSICSSSFSNGLGPYSVILSYEDYYNSVRKVSKDINFLEIPNSSGSGSGSGGIASPTPTVTVTAKPSPAPTVTVTATPAPAPTVTVTANAAPVVDPYFKNEATRLQGELTAMRSELDALKVKVAKICKVKPKPKYC